MWWMRKVIPMSNTHIYPKEQWATPYYLFFFLSFNYCLSHKRQHVYKLYTRTVEYNIMRYDGDTILYLLKY